MELNQILLTEINFSKLKNEVKKADEESKTIIYSSEDDDLNRKVIEKLPINILLINEAKRKDFQKQRDSGFNQVMAKTAKKRNITVGINFDEIIEETNLKKKSEILARIRQNIFYATRIRLK